MRADWYDLDYNDTSQDWAYQDGDLAPFLKTHYDVLSQALLDALESRFDSQKHSFPHWGFEGRDLNYSRTYSDDTPKVLVKQYLEEILGRMRHLVRHKSAFVTVAYGSGNTFTARVQCVLTDISATSFDRTINWSGTTKRASY